jgi:hypothetical protein
MDGGQGVAAGQVGVDAGEDLVIVEEPIELGQLRLELQAKLRDESEKVDGVVAVAKHPGCLPNAVIERPNSLRPPAYRAPEWQSISHRKLDPKQA